MMRRCDNGVNLRMYKLGNDVMKYASDFPVIGLNGHKGSLLFQPQLSLWFSKEDREVWELQVSTSSTPPLLEVAWAGGTLPGIAMCDETSA